MKRSLIGAIVTLGLAVVLISCGGGGASVGSPLSPQGRAVQEMQRFWLLSMANNGMGMPFFFGGGGGTSGTTGGGGGGFVGYPSMGGFIRHFGGPNGFRPTRGEGGTSGTTGTTSSGGGGEPQFYFDEWLQLWVDTSFTETSFSSLLYIDQAKTQPAGHLISNFTGNWNTYPQSFTSEYIYTAGTMSGAHGTYESTQENESTGHMTYANTYQDGATDEGQCNWNASQSSFSAEWHNAGNTRWYEDSGVWLANGTGTYNCSNSEGWSSEWHYNPDWSGSAHFEGPHEFLPADMTWTSDGHYRIVWADGKIEEWSWEDWWGGGTTGGTSGSTTGGSDGGTVGSTSALTTGGTSAGTSGSTSGSTGALTTGG